MIPYYWGSIKNFFHGRNSFFSITYHPSTESYFQLLELLFSFGGCQVCATLLAHLFNGLEQLV